MESQNNIFKKWWFNFIVVPVLSLVISFSTYFVKPEWEDSDKTLLFWLIVISLAVISETFILSIRKVKYRSNHYLYILISSNLSLFISFVINRFDLISIKSLEESRWWWWINEIIQMLFQVALLFFVKMVVWYSLHSKQLSKKNKDAQFEQALEKVQELEQENLALKRKIYPEQVEKAPDKPLSSFDKFKNFFRKEKKQQEKQQFHNFDKKHEEQQGMNLEKPKDYHEKQRVDFEKQQDDLERQNDYQEKQRDDLENQNDYQKKQWDDSEKQDD